MLRGSDGMAGGGIYFVANKHETKDKARATGYLVVAKVRLGTTKTISSIGDPRITFKSLVEDGYDSVKLPRHNGDEYVVYSSDQVEVLEVKRRKWRSKW